MLSANIEARGHTTHNNECRERIRALIERTLTGMARVDAHKGRVAETERVKQGTRARVESGADDVRMVRQNVDIHTSKEDQRHHEEQPDKLRKTLQSEQEAPNTSSSSTMPNTSSSLTMHVSLEYLARSERQDRTEPVLVQKSGHVDDDILISALDVFTRWMDERVVTPKKCWIGIEKRCPRSWRK